MHLLMLGRLPKKDNSSSEPFDGPGRDPVSDSPTPFYKMFTVLTSLYSYVYGLTASDFMPHDTSFGMHIV